MPASRTFDYHTFISLPYLWLDSHIKAIYMRKIGPGVEKTPLKQDANFLCQCHQNCLPVLNRKRLHRDAKGMLVWMAQYTSYLTRALCRKCLVFLRINGPINGKTSIHVVACVASVSVRFKSKEQGTRVKDRAAKKEDPVLFISFYSLNRVKGMNYQ